MSTENTHVQEEQQSTMEQSGFASPSTSSLQGASLPPPPFQLRESAAVVQRQETDPAPAATVVDIQSSVGGEGGVNRVADVRQVEQRLVELGLVSAAERINFEGREDGENMSEADIPYVIRGLTYFQRGVRDANDPDGRMDPGGATERSLNNPGQTSGQIQSATASQFNSDVLDPISIRIVQNVLGGVVDGDLTQDQRTTGAWGMTADSDSGARTERFQDNPTGYGGAAVRDAGENNDRQGWIEADTVRQVFGILTGANQHSYALYLALDFYQDVPDVAGAPGPRLNLGTALQVYYDPNLTEETAAYEEMGGQRTIAVGPTAFASAGGLRDAVRLAMQAETTRRESGMEDEASRSIDPDALTEEQQQAASQGLNATQVGQAISYNQGFFTRSSSVRVIQAVTGAPVNGAFDEATIRAIAVYQTAYNSATTGGNLNANGQMDPSTVTRMGGDLISRQEFNAAIEFAMDYYNIEVQEQDGTAFENPQDPGATMRETRSHIFTSVVYDPNLAEAFSSDRDLNATNANERIRDVRGVGAVRIGQAAFANFTTLVTSLSQAVSDVVRPGEGQLTTEGANRGLIPPLGDMSTFQVPYGGGWQNNAASGWPGAKEGHDRGRRHAGWDLYAPTGTPLRACCDGTAFAMTQTGYGSVVMLFDGQDRVYFYAHLSSWGIPQGQQTQVTQGQTVGYVGYSGNGVPQRPHVHFEVRSGTDVYARTKLDPDDYFRRPTRQRFYSAEHEDMIITEIPNDTEFPYPGVAQQAGNAGDGN